ESETDRHYVNSQVSEAALRELYLMPFEICIDDAHAWTLMAAYNDVNGAAATEHDELNNVLLKSEWAWDGLLMSDWGATKTSGPSANGGLDLVMPGPDGPWGAVLVGLVEAGEVEEVTIDEHLRRLLRLAGRVGALDGVPAEREAELDDPPAPTDPVVREALRDLASGGMVLLKGQDVLPLDDGAVSDQAPLVLVGAHALTTTVMGGGSASLRPPHEISIAEGLTEALGGDRVRVVDGVEVRQNPLSAAPDQVADPQTGNPGVRIVSFDEDGTERASTTGELAQIILGMGDGPHNGASELELSARLTAPAGSPVRIGVRGAGRWTLSYGDESFPVELAPPAGAEEVGFMAPPTWTTTVAAAADQILVARLNGPLGERFTLAGLIAEPARASDDDAIAAAVQAARDAETAVVVVGLTAEQETEGVDKATLALPGRQDELVAAVAATARRTVVVVNAATPILMPWMDRVDTLLWVGLPGQEGGHAVADVLLGRAEPTGRLVTTFPAADGDGPAWSVTPVGGALPYTEGTRVGYRGWEGGPVAPAFWFGEGLGWGRWDYADPAYAAGADGETVTVRLTNTANRPSREVVQVYWRPAESDAPVRLVGYAVADQVMPGEERSVTVPCDARAFRLWDTDSSSWTTPAGGTLLVARGLGDVRLELPRG
ncbi:MAG TPA: glycoside hydrolase family 3 C-terminal domain-containing protein, partial [Propionibacteriaceae bacterium]|nr:glycoside hydrolase family 3 C-terminal domain-containing protein [Propionibacteriaceae bacterium]